MTMQIFVRVITASMCKTFVFEVESSDTVDSVKVKLEDLLGLPTEHQKLQYNANILYDGRKRLSDLNIKNQSTLQLTMRFLCECQWSIYIYVQTRTSRNLALQVDPSSDTVTDVRGKINGHQSLFLAGKKLDDDRTFRSYDEIKNGTTLHLDFGMQVFAKMTRNGSKTIIIDVEPSDTVSDVKAKIHDQRRLVFDGSRLNNKRKLDFYDQVQHHSTLHLDDDLCRSPRDDGVQIAVKTTLPGDGSEAIPIWFKVRLSDKIGDFKAKIQDLQRLLFEGQQLVDVDGDGKTMTLADYNIQRQSTLQLDCPMQVYVNTTSTGQTITLEVEPSDTIDQVKEKIVGGDHQSLALYFDSKKLDDGKTLAECNVHMWSMMHLDTA